MRHFFLRISKLLIAISLVLQLLSAIASTDDLPDLAQNNDERSLSNSSYILGQYWFRKINGSRGLIEFPPAYNYLRQAIAEFIPNTGLTNKTVELALLNSSKMNAFVIPGNHLFIYSDILRVITNESMFMGLLAHEISHLELHHYQRTLENQKNEQTKALLLLLAGVAAATSGNGETSSALWLGGVANQQENLLSYSRAHEKEADRRGRELLDKSGLPQTGMNQLLAALFKEAMGDNRIEFLSTHPLPQNRLSDSLSGEQQKSVLFHPSSSSFRYFRATLLAYRSTLESPKQQTFLRRNLTDDNEYYYALTLSNLLLNNENIASQSLAKITDSNEFIDYLKAITALTLNDLASAEKTIHDRLTLAPDDLTFEYLSGQLQGNARYLYTSDSLLSYQRRMIYRHNIAVAKQSNNHPYALYNYALLQFSLGKEIPALNLINRSIKQSSHSQKQEMQTMKAYLERIIDAQKREKLE